MHVLHWIAVEADSAEEAFDEVVSTLVADGDWNTVSWADWSDWHVVGGGRWSNSQYDNSPEMVKSYTEHKEEFEEALLSVRKNRVNTLDSFWDRVSIVRFEKQITDYIETGGEQDEKEPYDMNLWYIGKIAKILSNEYNPDSFFYDLHEHSANMSYLSGRIAEKPEKQFLVPVDFHY